jgi:uncharacterized membrane protein YraQ (UPF0718 family)
VAAPDVRAWYYGNWAMVWPDIAGGLLIAGVLALWVPNAFWQSFFLTAHPTLDTLLATWRPCGHLRDHSRRQPALGQ